MSSDYEKRLKALYEEAFNEKDPEKLKQLISEILAVLEAHLDGSDGSELLS